MLQNRGRNIFFVALCVAKYIVDSPRGHFHECSTRNRNKYTVITNIFVSVSIRLYNCSTLTVRDFPIKTFNTC